MEPRKKGYNESSSRLNEANEETGHLMMALDVHLTRDTNERWGFELVGGADEEMPLTILKMDSSSPASRAGLRSGDMIFTINGEEAIDFTHEEACRKIAECEDTLTVGLMRGLYDPVLDDQDPILYEPGDLDPESQPTEVSFKIQQFIEPADLGSSPIDYGDINNPSTPFDPSILLAESRSLTASPFMNPNKPYRPFSTEPLPEVPPLEDPIILNPNYNDQFGKSPSDIDPDFIINAHYKNDSFESKFKLPISEQYDPDGTRHVKNAEVDNVLSKYINMEMLSKTSVTTDEKISKTTVRIAEDSKDVKRKERVSKDISLVVTTEKLNTKEDNFKNNVEMADRRDLVTQDVEEKMITEELKYMEKMRQETNVDQIEITAHSVVEDSIERAISVAEDIKNEMEVELNLDVEENVETVINEAEKPMSTLKTEPQIKSVIETIKIKETDFEVIDKIASNKEHLKYVEEDVHEQHSKTEDQSISESVSRNDNKESLNASTGESKNITKTLTTDIKSDKSGAQQRIYEIGLQTIPNITGVVHSSYHYDLLLRTFFLHLTDVMVALSRFLLTQPIFNTSRFETHKTVSESQTESDVKDVRKSQLEVVESVKTEELKVDEVKRRVEVKHDKIVKKKEEVMKPAQEKLVKKRELVTPISMIETNIESHERTRGAKKDSKTYDLKHVEHKEKSDVKQEQKKGECTTIVQVDEKKTSGAQMAQRTEKKLTNDMTQKMDAVISEFQTIAVEEDKKERLQRSRRSRSRSQIEEEVAKESDPLELLAKVDSRRASQEISEERLSKKESSTESFEKRHYEKLQKQEIKYKKAKTPKQMYVAIVEAHVYTNKDVIFEDAAEFSETSSVQSADEVSTAFEAIEAMQSENVLLENAVQQFEQAKIVEDSQELSRVTAQSEATVQKIEEVLHESKNIQEEKYKKESAIQSTDIQEVIIQETKEAIEPVVEIREIVKKENVSVDIKESFYQADSSEINVHESKSEFTSTKIKEQSVAVIEEDNRESIAVQSIAEVKVAEQEIVKAKTKVESQVQIEEDITEKVVVKAEKTDIKKEEEYAALKIVKEIETEVDTTNEVIEVEEVEVNKIQISKELQLDQSAVVIEESKISSELEMSIGSQSKTTSDIDISSTSNHMLIENYQSESHITESSVQESSFTAKLIDKKLTVRTDLKTQESIQSEPSTIDTPTPSTVPPTPLTDEYVFKLTIPLPKSRSTTPIPRDCTLSPEDEDPHIVKKKLIPHIETTIDKIVYDPPLPTPPGGCPLSPIFKTPGLFGGSSKPVYKIKFPMVYRKPGLFGGADNPEFSKEEIREIERKSSLLASAIDETIKSIEEYKEEVGIETKKEVKATEFKEETTAEMYQESYSVETVKESKQNGFEEFKTSIEEIVEKNFKAKDDTSVANEIAKDDTSVAIKIEKEETTEKLATGIQNLNSQTEPVEEINVKIEQEIIPEKRIEVERPTNIREVKESEIKNIEVFVETIDISQVNEHEKEVKESKLVEEENKKDPMAGFRPVVFDLDSIQKRRAPHFVVQEPTTQDARGSPYLTESGEIIGTIQGIVDGLEEPVMDPELAKELGKPGITEEKIAELISGEAEMLREAHVMGLSRVLNSHMHRADDSSVDFQKIKPMIDSLKDSEVLKALNEDLARQKEEEKKKEKKRWTTFLQKPKRPPPKVKFGYYGWTEAEQAIEEEPYKVKIVKQAKPKVAPDYKPEDFETGPLPWEQRAETESSLPPVEPEEPILVPELPEYLEAVDPLTESEVPDLEDTGLPLPPPREPTPPPVIEQIQEVEQVIEQEAEVEEAQEVIEEEKQETREDMENKLAEQLVRSVQSMVDPNAPVEQQLSQMRAQLAALAQLPEVIQQTLELVSRQLNKMGHQETRVEVSASHAESYNHQEREVIQNHVSETMQEHRTIQDTEQSEKIQNSNTTDENDGHEVTIEEVQENMEPEEKTGYVTQECRRVQTPQTREEEMRNEKMQKEHSKLEADARQIKQRSAPRVGKPTRMFGPLDPDSRPVVLPGGRRWRKTSDVYNEQLIAETLQAQSELIRGKTMGFESDLLPYDERINFMKYEKPPVSLDHLQNSETYKLVHDMDQPPLKKVEMLRPVISEADYRERCRSNTPSGAMKHLQIPQQFHP